MLKCYAQSVRHASQMIASAAAAAVCVLVLAAAEAGAAISITAAGTAPTIGADDQYFLPGAVNDTDNLGGPVATSADNDAQTYIAPDRNSQGQSFTTGSNALGYTIDSITIQHALWSSFLSNGTWYNIQDADTFEFQFGTISGTTKTPLLTDIATYSGSAIVGNGTSGTGTFLTFDMSAAGLGVLSANTTYYFLVAPETGGAYFETNGMRTGAAGFVGYAGGVALTGDAAGTIGTGVVARDGDRAFHAALTAVAIPAPTALNGAMAIGLLVLCRKLLAGFRGRARS